MHTFTMQELEDLGVCLGGMRRVERFGGQIENSKDDWHRYVKAYPNAWRAPIFTAQLLHDAGRIVAPDLVWQYARMAFRFTTIPAFMQLADSITVEAWPDIEAWFFASDWRYNHSALSAINCGRNAMTVTMQSVRESAYYIVSAVARLIDVLRWSDNESLIPIVERESIDLAIAAMDSLNTARSSSNQA